jgi:5-hydroxyisourate hydrolase
VSRLSTHILNTARGAPAAGVAIDLFRLEGEGRRKLASAVTNADGRTDGPLLDGEDFMAAEYELVFHIGAYFRSTSADSGFFDTVPIRFRVSDPALHHHVPLLVTPWSYTTYRGS